MGLMLLTMIQVVIHASGAEGDKDTLQAWFPILLAFGASLHQTSEPPTVF